MIDLIISVVCYIKLVIFIFIECRILSSSLWLYNLSKIDSSHVFCIQLFVDSLAFVTALLFSFMCLVCSLSVSPWFCLLFLQKLSPDFCTVSFAFSMLFHRFATIDSAHADFFYVLFAILLCTI